MANPAEPRAASESRGATAIAPLGSSFPQNRYSLLVHGPGDACLGGCHLDEHPCPANPQPAPDGRPQLIGLRRLEITARSYCGFNFGHTRIELDII